MKLTNSTRDNRAWKFNFLFRFLIYVMMFEYLKYNKSWDKLGHHDSLGQSHSRSSSEHNFFLNWSTRLTHSHGQYCSMFLHMSSVRPSVCPHFPKQNKFHAKTMFATDETMSLAE